MRLAHRHHAEHDEIHQAEDGRVRADAEGEREDGGTSEHRAAQQEADAVAAIDPKVFKPADAALVAAGFLGLLEAAQGEHGLALSLPRIDTLRDEVADLI